MGTKYIAPIKEIQVAKEVCLLAQRHAHLRGYTSAYWSILAHGRQACEEQRSHKKISLDQQDAFSFWYQNHRIQCRTRCQHVEERSKVKLGTLGTGHIDGKRPFGAASPEQQYEQRQVEGAIDWAQWNKKKVFLSQRNSPRKKIG